MPRLSRRDAKVGMIVGRDVSNPRGQLLIAAGTSLTEKHIGALQLWGISHLHIHSPEEDASAEAASLVSREALEGAKERAVAVFRFNRERLNTPFFRCLLAQAIMRFARDVGNRPVDEALGVQNELPSDGEPYARTAAEMVSRIGTLGSLPTVYHEIIQVVNHPLSSATDVANVISKDVGLTARLLRIVNSAFYGFPGRIETVSRATTIVGTNELCELALATSVISVFDRALRGVVNMSDFWLHSLFCGSVARMLGKFRGETNTERYFVMGLLHDVGRLVMFSEAPRRTREVLEEAANSQRPVYDVERDMFGFTHAAVGQALLKAWNLPAPYREAVRCHHVPLSSKEQSLDVAVAHVSEIIANALGLGRSGDTAVPPMSVEAWEQLNLNTDVLVSVMEEAETHVRDLANIFGVEDS